jgi:4-amino-4-deoxy-L-arabinose transferase-like glycosyltransferase
MLIGQRVFIGSVVVAVAVALFLHFWRIGSAPPGFYVDECSITYNAYCIAETGADEYGVRWPVFFRSFDTYTDPVNVYSVALPIRVFGLREWAARLPSALYYLVACVAFYMLLRAWQLGKWFALAGGLVLSAIPWVFPLSRNCAFAGQTAALLGLVMGLMLTDSALRRRSNWRAVLAGVAWAFAFSAHQSIRPVLALLALGCGVALWRPLVRRWRVILVTAISALVVLLPMIISVLRFPAALLARFHQIGISRGAASLWDAIVGVASRYLDYFRPRFLFIAGDHELRHHTGWGGELYWCLAPVILAGLYVAMRYWRRQPRYRVVLVGLLVSPVSAALTVDRMHSTRCVYGVVFWLLLAMVGAHWLWQHRRVGRKLLVVACAVGALESSAYLADYFGPYQKLCRHAFMAGLTEGLKYSFQRINGNQTFYVDDSVGVPYGVYIHTDFKPLIYAHLLFYGGIDPQSYQREGFSNSAVQPYLGRIEKPGLLLRCNYTSRLSDVPPSAGMQSHIPVPSGAKLLATFEEGTPLEYQVFEVR